MKSRKKFSRKAVSQRKIKLEKLQQNKKIMAAQKAAQTRKINSILKEANKRLRHGTTEKLQARLERNVREGIDTDIKAAWNRIKYTSQFSTQEENFKHQIESKLSTSQKIEIRKFLAKSNGVPYNEQSFDMSMFNYDSAAKSLVDANKHVYITLKETDDSLSADFIRIRYEE